MWFMPYIIRIGFNSGGSTMFTKAALRARRKSRDASHVLRDEPYYLGDAAWHFGQPEKANPFSEDTEEHTDWRAGWQDAEFEHSVERG